MSGAACAGCGAPLRAGAAFCSYCGRPVPNAAGPAALAGSGVPLASSSGTPLPPSSSYAPPLPARRSRLRTVLVVLVVIVVVVAAVGLLFVLTTPPNVDVVEIDLYAPDDVCGLQTSPYGYFGFNDSAGTAEPLELSVHDFNATACTVQSVVTNTSGFSVSGVQVPDTIPGLGNGTLNLTLTLPGNAFTGAVNLVLS